MEVKEERRISPAIIIPIGLVLGGGGALIAMTALARVAPPVVIASLYGAVSDAETGQPISGVLVTLNGIQVATDINGAYAFTDLDPGTYSISFAVDGYEPLELVDMLVVEGDNQLNVSLTRLPPPLANVYGVVRDADTGAALANATVELWSPDGLELLLSTSTNSAGAYSMADILPGNYSIQVIRDGYHTLVSDVSLVSGDNELNIQMAPIVIEPFTFTSVRVEKVIMLDAPAWETMNFFCTITNPNNFTVTEVISVFVRWAAGSPAKQWAFELTLGPGQSYNFAWYGNTFGQRDPDAYNGPLVARRQRVCMWLEDEQGNKSAEGCVTGKG